MGVRVQSCPLAGEAPRLRGNRLTPPRRRLDAELVRRGLVDSRERAAVAVSDGRVLVAGSVATKASRMVAAEEPVVVVGPDPPFVSRGGEKLDAALSAFALDVAGLRALDAGASTGGFVDCLLQRGASEVIAIDVGRGQLDARLRSDPRVVVREGCNIRSVTPTELGDAGPVDVVTADLSFISLRTVGAALVTLVRPGGDLVVLVKPQFEAGRVEASRGKGVIREPSVWRDALVSVASSLGAAGTGIMGAMASPLRGAAGNVEFFLRATASAAPTSRGGIEALADEAIASVDRAG